MTEPTTEPPAATDAAPTNTSPLTTSPKCELQVAEIKTADRIEGATKLLRLTVDIGEERDTADLVAGIAESYAPEDLPGRKIVVVANLRRARCAALKSQGMLLAATDADGNAVLLHPRQSGRSRPARR